MLMNSKKEKQIQKKTDRLFKKEKSRRLKEEHKSYIKRHIVKLYFCILFLVAIDIFTAAFILKSMLSGCDFHNDTGCGFAYAWDAFWLGFLNLHSIVIISIVGAKGLSLANKYMNTMKPKVDFPESYRSTSDIGLAIFVILIIISVLLTLTLTAVHQ